MVKDVRQDRRRPADLETELTSAGLGWGGGRQEGSVRESGTDACTLLCLRWTTPRDPQQSTANSAQRCVAAWVGGELGAACVCVAESLRCSPETLTTLLTGYIPTQNKKF